SYKTLSFFCECHYAGCCLPSRTAWNNHRRVIFHHRNTAVCGSQVNPDYFSHCKPLSLPSVFRCIKRIPGIRSHCTLSLQMPFSQTTYPVILHQGTSNYLKIIIWEK